MEFKGTKRAEEYASGKSSSAVFRENHIKDYLNGYNQALEDSKYTEMMEMLNEVCENLALQLDRLGVCGEGDDKGRKADADSYGGTELLYRAKQLIKEATYLG